MFSCMCLHLLDTMHEFRNTLNYALTFNQSERSKLLFPSLHLTSLSLNTQCDGSQSIFLSKAARATSDRWRKWHFVFGTSTKRNTSGEHVVTYRFVGVVASVNVKAFVLFCLMFKWRRPCGRVKFILSPQLTCITTVPLCLFIIFTLFIHLNLENFSKYSLQNLA